ncbi:MAG: gamma-glutamyl-gamma-aminobutyrate hydrolase family protein [Clostridia bacterium]|nr:gamma-glutamyl-gamma-aminobutyrate hydrolase family protein [Clostridia bacterium]
METKKPRILLSCGKDATANVPYAAAVEAAGGVPVLAHAPEADPYYDGLLLCGGVDIAPALYGRETAGTEQTDPARDAAELALVATYLAYKKPIFGICRGVQMLNVALGGTLLQNIVGHRAPVRGEPCFHPARAVEGSILYDLYDRDFQINTYHHQALLSLGNGLIATAHSPDGVIEGVEHTSLPVFGVQWHPERILNGEGGSAPGLPLFRYFLCLCQEGEGYLFPQIQKNPDVRFACGIIGEE